MAQGRGSEQSAWVDLTDGHIPLLLAAGRRALSCVRMHKNASTAWDYFGSCVFVAHKPGPLIDDDFADFLEDVLAQTHVRSVIVRASEGAPRADHRSLLLRWYRTHSVRGAVLTSSLLARGGVTALSWFGVAIKAFEPQHLDAAFEYIGIAARDWTEARRRLQGIVAWVDGQPAPVARDTP